jgi:hypothetical protein
MTTEDPTHTVHFAIARITARRTGNDTPTDTAHGASILAWTLSERVSTPELRRNYTMTVYSAWILLGLAVGGGLVACAYLAHLMFGREAGNIVVSAAAGCSCFCFAGAVNALWRQQYANQAQRRLRRFGPGDHRYKTSMRRALPRDSSLIGQAIVGAIAAIITAMN